MGKGRLEAFSDAVIAIIITIGTNVARLHVVWLWLAVCVVFVLLSEITGAGMLDGGFGSALFGVLLLLGAPFLVVGRLAWR
jgi:hypothetical protein